MRKVLVPFALLAALLAPRSGRGWCRDPAQCFCPLKPYDCHLLVEAEVTAADTERITLKVLGAPIVDPSGILKDGDLVADLKAGGGSLVVGARGLFNVFPASCSSVIPPEGFITASRLLEGSAYRCERAPEFPGATREQVIEVVLAADCVMAANKLMGTEDVCRGESGCCYSIGVSLQGLAGTLIGLIVLLPARRRHTNHTGAHG